MASSSKKYFGIPYVLIISGFALAASLAIIIVLNYAETTTFIKIVDGQIALPHKSIWIVILEHVATATFILGIWHTLDHIFIRKEFNSEISEHFEALKSDLIAHKENHDKKLERMLDSTRDGCKTRIDDAKSHFVTAKHDIAFGLVSTHHESNHFAFTTMIEQSHRLTAVMADGHTWFSRHTEAFISRFGDPGKQTTFIFVHPDSELIDILSRKIGISPAIYRERIYSTVREIRRAALPQANIRFLGHSLINCHSVYIADNEAIYSPYFLSSQRRIPPAMVLKNAGVNSFFHKLVADVALLAEESSVITLPEERTPVTPTNGN